MLGLGLPRAKQVGLKHAKKNLRRCERWFAEPPHKEISPSPQYQPNRTFCTAGEGLLTWCAGLRARAQACHKDRKKNINSLELRF